MPRCHENCMYIRAENKIFFVYLCKFQGHSFIIVSSIGCSTVFLAVTRLTVYRQLQVRIGAPSSEFDYRPIVEFRVVFSKNLDFLCTNTPFSDFSGLDLMFAEAHARGFAPV